MAAPKRAEVAAEAVSLYQLLTMKTFQLTCPHCRQVKDLGESNIDDWYDSHVSVCRADVDRLAFANRPGFMLDKIAITGRVLIKLFRDGELNDARLAANLVVNAGKDWVVDRFHGSPPAVMDYQAVGTDNTAAAAGQTALITEVARVQGTLSQPASTTDRLVTSFGAGVGTGALVETGRLNAAAAGTLLARQVFSVINKGAGDTLQTTHDITVS